MKIGLLNCDHVREELRTVHGDYPAMFGALLPSIEFEVFNVCEGQFPDSVEHCAAYMATGSKCSVYDDVDWILQLKAFVKEIHDAGKPFAGVCFGHQMLAEALGGKVEKSKNGWCVGVHEFEILQKENWMEPFEPNLNVLMSCQDQVVELPDGSIVLASSPLCPVAMFRVGEKMLGIQGHPEFSIEYDQALMESRTQIIGEETVRKGVESLSLPVHRGLVSAWLKGFIGHQTAGS